LSGAAFSRPLDLIFTAKEKNVQGNQELEKILLNAEAWRRPKERGDVNPREESFRVSGSWRP